MEVRKKIIDLPLELMNTIYENLSIQDKLSLAQANVFCKRSFAYHASIKFAEISCSDLKDYLSSILPICGASVKHIFFDEPDSREILLAEMHCTNLKSIKINLWDHEEEFKALINRNSGIENLELNEKGITSNIIQALVKLKNLKILKLGYYCDFDRINMCDINKLDGLEELVIGGGSINLCEMSSALKRIRSLDLYYVETASSTVEEKCTFMSLERLQIRCCKFKSGFPACPKLRSLRAVESLNPRSFNNFLPIFDTDFEFPALEDLNIDGTKGYGSLPKCPKLKTLTFFYDSTSEFYEWLSQHTQTVESLDITIGDLQDNTMFKMPTFPTLRSVTLDSDPYHLLWFVVYKWVSKHFKSLRIFNLKHIAMEMEDQYFLKMLSTCTNIRSMQISSFIFQYSSQFWISFFEILKNNGYTSDQPLMLKSFFRNPHHEIPRIFQLPNSETCTYIGQ